jgi:hypothetical protein
LAKNDYISSAAEQGVSYIEISAKAIAAGQRSKRKKILYASSIVAGSLLGAISLFMSFDDPSAAAKTTAHVIAGQTYFNEWPSNSGNQPVHTKFHQRAESTQVSAVISKQSILHSSEEGKELSEATVAQIRSELMEMHSVSFKQPSKDQLLALNIQPVAMQAMHAKGLVPKKNFNWFIGISFNLQLSNYEISRNSNKFNTYDGYTHTNYVSNLKGQSKVYSYNAGVKGGFTYNKKWMVEAGITYQSFRYLDNKQEAGCYSMAGPIVNGPWVNNAAIASSSYRYMNFSLQASRMFDLGKVGVKTGLSFSAARLLSANTVVADGQHMFSLKKHHHGQPLSKWIYAPGLHIGVVKNFSDRVQMQASPNLYYNLNSMFNRNYIVSQKPYGVGLDLSLMIRIN